eukprot:TRINITY_DN2096_c1_g9_i1.p1 TRINITY_DN2096_c1_g9~~TRINITY_DN2096_c1_g9_i1.p1  ORF type:complete len:406 (-),score=83.28 TRINITY_DN2096_c1_g9_i1:330-1547(-)
MSYPFQENQQMYGFEADIFGASLDSGFGVAPAQSKRKTEPFAADVYETPSSIPNGHPLRQVYGGPVPHPQSQPISFSHPSTNGGLHPNSSRASAHGYQTSSSFEYSDPALSPFGTQSSFEGPPGALFDDVTETTEESKRSKKLEKNRESARMCRQRKKVYIHSLEEKVGRLSGRIQELQQEYWFTKEKLREEQRKVAIALESLVHGKDTDKDCAMLLARFSDICYKQGQSAILYHLEQIKELLIPAQQLKFILWGLDQHDEFYDMGSKSSGGTIWSMLSEELGWTDQQRERLVQYRDFIRNQNKELTGCIQRFDLLRDDICHRLDSLQRCVNEIRTLFTPQQQAKFVVWVEQNQAVMKMLNSVMAQPRERTAEPPSGLADLSISGQEAGSSDMTPHMPETDPDFS